MIGHVAGHVMGQTWFGHVTFPWSRASEVPESQFVTHVILVNAKGLQNPEGMGQGYVRVRVRVRVQNSEPSTNPYP
jgi:hypothetical protein